MTDGNGDPHEPLARKPQGLRGQLALVTGAGRGLGRAYAVALAAAGARVVVVARSRGEVDETAKIIERAGGHAYAVDADVSDRASVERVAAHVHDTHGTLDLLVNNAAISGPIGPTLEADPDEWWRAQEVNVRGPFLCCRVFAPSMVSRGRGRIINVSSGAGSRGIPYMSAYVASKTALTRFTEVLASEIRDTGVLVFAIEPGTVRTAMAEMALHTEAGQRWLPWFKTIFEQGRHVTAERSAAFVLSIASGAADAFSGRVLTVHDDLDALIRRATREPMAPEARTLRLFPL